jgi:hypothetical protein
MIKNLCTSSQEAPEAEVGDRQKISENWCRRRDSAENVAEMPIKMVKTNRKPLYPLNFPIWPVSVLPITLAKLIAASQ